MKNWFNKIFGSQFAGVLCFLFAITNRIIFATLYSLIGVDTKLQLVYAKNFMAGKGLGETRYFANDLNTPVFSTHQLFPPGFSFAIMPFLKLFGGDEYKAVFVFDILVAILFIVAVRLLGNRAGLSNALNNIVVLIAGCSQYFFFMSWSSTDAVGVCLLLWALVVTIAIIYKKKNIGVFKALIIGLLFCSPFFFRYMYLPIALLLPLLILVGALVSKNKTLKSAGLKIFAATASLLILYFILSLSLAGNALYITNVGRGFFVDQLTECYPFLPASFINIDFAAQLVQTVSGIDYSETMLFLQIINPVIFIVLIFLLAKYIFTHRMDLALSRHSLFIVIGSFISFAIILLLSWLTVTYKELSWGFYKWTHVQDPRYYAFIYVFVPLLLFICMYNYSSLFKAGIVRFFVFAALCCFAIETVHGIYYNIKILVAHKDLEYIRSADKGFRSFPMIIIDIKKKYPGRQVIVCSPDQFYLHTASQIGYKAVFDYDNFLRSGLRVSSKSILIMPIQSRDVEIISKYIEEQNPNLFFTVAGTSFYVQEINP